ncbi:MAG: formylglycine-generating enzyme family protein, partial [Armatimonadetes bacterium]|nr:formylglycine-generating enzyme family protein [Armatimonadota bacterium]
EGAVYVIEAKPAPPAPVTPAATLPADWPPAYLEKWRNRLPKGLYRIRAIDGMPQVLIPAGEFLMGSPRGQFGEADERPQKRVYESAFWIDQHEVTVGQYRRFCRAAGKQMASGNSDDTHPVVNVDWNDADAYAKWAGGSLLTEAQWEKAARGGLEGMAYPWGNEFDEAKANNGNGTKPVASYAPNGYGLFDMAGNVWEWCADWYYAAWYAKMPTKDPVNTTQSGGRVVRGGSWGSDASYLRVADRGYGPVYRHGDVGFRCCEAL